MCFLKKEIEGIHLFRQFIDRCSSISHCQCMCVFKDNIPELAESFLVNITSVELVGGSVGAGKPSLKRPGMEVAEVTIQENDDPRGILQFNMSEVSTVSSLKNPNDNS